MVDFRPHVDRLFRQMPKHTGALLENPITGETWLHGHDPEAPHKRRAERALVARARYNWHNSMDAPDAPDLPLHRLDIASFIKSEAGLFFLVGVFAQSVAGRDWDIGDHPPFAYFARCVVGSPHAPWLIKKDQTLSTRFPPRHDDSLQPSLWWRSG